MGGRKRQKDDDIITIYDKWYPKNIIRFSNASSSFLSKHPTQKPVALIEYLIKTYTNEGEIVLDFASGSGTTGIACKNTGRRCVLIEKEESYCELSAKRLEKNTIQSELF